MKIFYGSHAKQFGDLYVPNSTTPVPVIVVIHGGYWKDKNTLDIYPTKSIVDEYKDEYAIWNLEYRGIPEIGTIPLADILHDIKTGFEHLATLTTHNLDLTKVLLVGHSAGGHLMTWLLGEELAIRPSRAICVSGVLDLSQYCYLTEPTQVEKLINHDFDNMPWVDPIVRGHGSTHLTVVHGLDDQTVPYLMASNYADKWYSELILLENCDHFGMLPLDDGEYWNRFKEIIEDNMHCLNSVVPV